MAAVPPSASSTGVAVIFFTVLASTTVVLRLGTRALLVKQVGPDDYLMISALFGSVFFCVEVARQIEHGLGRHITFPELAAFLQAVWLTTIAYNLTQLLCGLSIIVQYYRIFYTPVTNKILNVYLVFTILFGIWTVFGTIFRCWPINTYWNITGPGVCMNQDVVTFTNAGIHIVSDFALLLFPLALLRTLNIAKQQKRILLGLFGVGIFGCVASIIRLYALYESSGLQNAPLERVYHGTSIDIWSGIEINIAIICASIPSLRRLASKMCPRLVICRNSRQSFSRVSVVGQTKRKSSEGSRSMQVGDGNVHVEKTSEAAKTHLAGTQPR